MESFLIIVFFGLFIGLVAHLCITHIIPVEEPEEPVEEPEEPAPDPLQFTDKLEPIRCHRPGCNQFMQKALVHQRSDGTTYEIYRCPVCNSVRGKEGVLIKRNFSQNLKS